MSISLQHPRPTIRRKGEVIDLIAVERVLEGGRPRPRLTRAEREHAARLLHANGVPPGGIAHRLGVSTSSVRTALGKDS